MKKVIGIVISAVFAFAVFTAPAQAGGFATQQYRAGAFNTVKMFATTYAFCCAKDATLLAYRSYSRSHWRMLGQNCKLVWQNFSN